MVQYGSFNLVTAGPLYVILRSSLKSCYTQNLILATKDLKLEFFKNSDRHAFFKVGNLERGHAKMVRPTLSAFSLGFSNFHFFDFFHTPIQHIDPPAYIFLVNLFQKKIMLQNVLEAHPLPGAA